MADVSQFKLIIEDDEGRRSVVPVELGEVSIGRLEGNTIRLKERNVSRHHARLIKEGSGIFAEDLDSYNGLWINGDRVAGRHQLHDGDMLRIGDFHLELRGDGLNPRREETTQRTMLGDADTQPGFAQPEGRPADDPTVTGAKPVLNSEPTQIIDQDTGEAAEDRDAPTAIIRGTVGEDIRRPPTLLSGARAKLVCVSTQYAGHEFEITKNEMIMGRTDDNDIGVDHRSVSRQHAKIVVSGRRFKIVDLESANGTLVNGEAYAQTELKRGDLIELGHVKFRFVPPGESYNFTPEEIAIIRGGGRSGGMWRSTLLWSALGLIVMLLAIAVWLMLGGGDKASSDGLQLAPLPRADSQTDNDRDMTKVQGLMAQHQWSQAQNILYKADRSRPDVINTLRQVDLEIQAQQSLANATSFNNVGRWYDAWNALQEVPKESTSYPQALAMMAQVRPNVINELLGECRNSLKNEEWDDAENALDEVDGLDPGRKEITELRSAIDDGRKRHGGVLSSPTTDKHGSKSGRAKSKDSGKSSKLMSPLPSPLAAPSGAPPPTAPVPVKSPGDPFYQSAAAILTSKTPLGPQQLNQAVDLLNKCVAADPRSAICYRGLGITWAKLKNGPKAAHFYRLYLKINPQAKDADLVRTFLKNYDEQESAVH